MKLVRKTGGSNIINLDALPSGVYFLSLEIDSKLHIQKIIINKQ
ncbi:MAG: T9SS type A sorting domain-containing protein [Bacteroidales bacterium]|nr:T9SS type A sorting domain-containing protein [Bacteroidales bacterium]